VVSLVAVTALCLTQSVTPACLPLYCTLLLQECQGGGGKGSVLVVKGLTEGQVASAEEALALIQQGQENRKVQCAACCVLVFCSTVVASWCWGAVLVVAHSAA
jgi:hypothetical protein